MGSLPHRLDWIAKFYSWKLYSYCNISGGANYIPLINHD